MVDSRELVDRIRDALAAYPSVREVKMFGGLSFMVNQKMVVYVRSDGDLLVRSDPERPTNCSHSREHVRPRWGQVGP